MHACIQSYNHDIEKNAGHGAGRSTEQIIGENADLLSFALYEMGIRSLKSSK
jgi:prolyl oligopeptidase